MKPIFAGLLLTLSSISPAYADIILFSDKAAFLNTFSVTELFLPSPNLTLTRNTAAISNGFSSLLTGNAMGFGFENFQVTIDRPVLGFGFDIHEPSIPVFPRPTPTIDTCGVLNCADSTFLITLISGGRFGTRLGSFTVEPIDDALTFVGLQSTTAFDTISVFETIGTSDNELFGNFIFAESLNASVPLPATLWLFGIGLFGLTRSLKK